MNATLTIEKPALEELVSEKLEGQPEAALTLELPVGESLKPVVFDPYNERVKLYGVDPQVVAEAAATEFNSDLASKITVYALPGEDRDWQDMGFQKEAVISGFFPEDDAHIWAAYTDQTRGEAEREAQHQETVQFALSKEIVVSPPLGTDFRSDIARVEDSSEIASVLEQTFTDYPTPISEEVVASQISEEDNLFRVVRTKGGEVAAVASAELDHERSSAEMTDCATLPKFRGRGLMAYILRTLEQDVMRRYGIEDLYTIARADEVGMNCVFSKLGYRYEGRLINNCRMPNGWESMNVWCRNTRSVQW